MSERTVEKVLQLDAPVERVWRAITDPVELASWFGDEAEVDLRPGGDAAMIWEKHGRYAMRIEGRLYVPVYQVVGQRLVPNIGRVNQAIADLDPVSVQRWITAADPDLDDMTPLNWLKTGRDVDAVLKVLPER